MKSLLLVFAKTPVLGTVKTRLATTVGAEKALSVYTQLLRKTNTILEELAQEVIVFYSGAEASTLQDYFPTFKLNAQKGTDLGERMQQAFQWGFSQGYKNLILIGTDLWEIETPLISLAFKQLQTHDCVIGPSTDGGYYLLGKKENIPAVFQNKAWSTASVLTNTLADLQDHQVALLPEKTDIDTYKEVELYPELVHLIYR
ncbi:MAG: TIGR04282 family arsenosugar biosynthesis glycosyltransferase [Flavobacteriaceae bacterium]|nr:glycosyltransferase [Flavobacteriia bacterium]